MAWENVAFVQPPRCDIVGGGMNQHDGGCELKSHWESKVGLMLLSDVDNKGSLMGQYRACTAEEHSMAMQ